MVRSIQTIEQDLAALEKILETLAQEFHSAYQDYLTALGRSIRQQFILASYHLCTQGFPEAFLALSFQRRQDLQGEIQSLGNQAQKRIINLIQVPFPAQLEQADSANNDGEQNTIVQELSLSDGSTPVPQPNSEEQSLDSPVEDGHEEWLDSFASEAPTQPITQPLTPRTLAQWQEKVEDAITEILKEISHSANCCFRDAGILSDALPDALLEIASKADMIAESTTSAPNLLQLRVESDAEPPDDNAAIAQLLVIHLRLSEIEFANPELMPWRTKIRDLSNQLAQLHREYRRKNHEKAIAEAESAWRSSWCEDPQ